MSLILRLTMAISLLLAATSSYAWFGNNNNNNNWGPWGGNNNNWGPWGGNNNYNPYDEWDPRYWMEEMENAFDDDNDYYGPGYGYGPYGMPQGGYYNGSGPYGPPQGYGYAPPQYNGPPPGYAPPGSNGYQSQRPMQQQVPQ